jgi:hypothetical protein
MNALAAADSPQLYVGEPAWIEPSLRITPGRDPLGIQTITIDRVMPVLVPGILALSRRARYFSFYSFLLDEFWRLRLASSMEALSAFIKAREYEYALAVQLCPRGCGDRASGVVGKERAGPVARQGRETYERGESVESRMGGYGLYYRTPLIALGIVAPSGTEMKNSNRLTPVDVLAGPDANRLAGLFREAVANTAYYREHMLGSGPIPAADLVEYAEHACLCRLSEYQAEQAQIRSALFATRLNLPDAEVGQRRRSFAMFLSLIDDQPDLVRSDAAFRSAIWDEFQGRRDERNERANTVAQWAALIAKEYLQEGLSSIWARVCQQGLAHQPVEGFDPIELDTFLQHELIEVNALNLPSGLITVTPDMPLDEFEQAVLESIPTDTLEELRAWTADQDSAVAGLALVLALWSRLPDPSDTPPGWGRVGSQRSEHQQGLLAFYRQFDSYRRNHPTLDDAIAWIARRYVLVPHESIAYSKLPNFTFRFRWEQGRLRFYDLDPNRFGLTDIRRDAFSRISEDVGLWTEEDGIPILTPDGRQFINDVFT